MSNNYQSMKPCRARACEGIVKFPALMEQYPGYSADMPLRYIANDNCVLCRMVRNREKAADRGVYRSRSMAMDNGFLFSVFVVKDGAGKKHCKVHGDHLAMGQKEYYAYRFAKQSTCPLCDEERLQVEYRCPKNTSSDADVIKFLMLMLSDYHYIGLGRPGRLTLDIQISAQHPEWMATMLAARRSYYLEMGYEYK